MCVCVFSDQACGLSEDDLMFSEDEDCSGGLTSQLKTPAAKGLLNLNRCVRDDAGRKFCAICLLVLSDFC